MFLTHFFAKLHVLDFPYGCAQGTSDFAHGNFRCFCHAIDKGSAWASTIYRETVCDAEVYRFPIRAGLSKTNASTSPTFAICRACQPANPGCPEKAFSQYSTRTSLP